MKDGRSKPPLPPDEIMDILITAAVNRTLGTHYTPEQVDALPQLFIDRVILVANS